MKRIVFIAHGKKRSARKIINRLRHDVPTCCHSDYVFTQYPAHAVELASSYAGSYDLLVVIGGDGLLHECVNGIMRIPGTRPHLALLPCGSGNDFSRNFDWIANVNHFLERLMRMEFILCDTGRIDHPDGEVTHFINEMSSGLSTAVVKRVAELPRYWPGAFRFGFSIVAAFFSYRRKHISIRANSFDWSGDAMLVVCANGKYFGSGVGIAPAAKLTDSLLDTVVIGDVSIIDYLKYLPALRRGDTIHHPHVHYFQCREIHWTSSNMIECDGEMKVETPARISVGPAIRLLV